MGYIDRGSIHSAHPCPDAQSMESGQVESSRFSSHGDTAQPINMTLPEECTHLHDPFLLRK